MNKATEERRVKNECLYENGQFLISEEFGINGYNVHGFDRDGYNRGGFNEMGFNREGFDRYGMNIQGYDENGINRMKYNKDGYDIYGYDIFGFSKEGFDLEGYDYKGDYNLFIKYYLSNKGIVISNYCNTALFNERVKELLKNLYYIEKRLLLYELCPPDVLNSLIEEKLELKKGLNVLIKTVKLYIVEFGFEKNNQLKLFSEIIKFIEENYFGEFYYEFNHEENILSQELYEILKELKENYGPKKAPDLIFSMKDKNKFIDLFNRTEQIILEWIKTKNQ